MSDVGTGGVDDLARRQLLAGWATTVALAGTATALARRGTAADPIAVDPVTGVPLPPGPTGMDPAMGGAAPPAEVPAAPDTALVSGTAPEIGVDPPGGDGIPDRTPLTGEALVLHVARRASFGATPELLAELRAVGPMAWIDAQLAPASIDDTVLDGMIRGASGFDALDWTNERAGRASEVDFRFLQKSLRHATVLRAVFSRRQLNEVVIDLFTNHLNTWMGHPEAGRYRHTDDRDVIRIHALGRFADLIQASAKSPAMLAYLDNSGSSAPSPNENYGRELLELHTVGVDGGYTEADVRGAATVLTGWTIDSGSRQFVFNPGQHDASPATVLGWSTPGRSGPGAQADGESLLDHLAHHPSTARHIATVLARRFVADDPPADTIDEGAAAYLASDTSIAATLRAILYGSAFQAGGGPKLRRPFEAVAAGLRATGASISPFPRNGASAAIDDVLARCGQRLFDRAAPDGYPDRATGWASSSSLIARWSFAAALCHDRLADIAVDPGRLIAGAPATAAEAVDAVAVALLGHPLAAERRGAIVGFLGLADGGPADGVHGQLREAAALVLCSPEAEYR